VEIVPSNDTTDADGGTMASAASVCGLPALSHGTVTWVTANTNELDSNRQCWAKVVVSPTGSAQCGWPEKVFER